VREVVNGAKVGPSANIYTDTDYYPFGQTARSDGTNYRYAYQGAYAESDDNTNLDNFKLRMYDSRIGRWLSVDPKGQDASPYEGMGNNPVTGTDPTGGFYQELWNWITGNGWISNAGRDFIDATPGATYNGWTGDKSNGYASVGYSDSKGVTTVTTFGAVDDLFTGKLINLIASIPENYQPFGLVEFNDTGNGEDFRDKTKASYSSSINTTDIGNLGGGWGIDSRELKLFGTIKKFEYNPFSGASTAKNGIDATTSMIKNIANSDNNTQPVLHSVHSGKLLMDATGDTVTLKDYYKAAMKISNPWNRGASELWRNPDGTLTTYPKN